MHAVAWMELLASKNYQVPWQWLLIPHATFSTRKHAYITHCGCMESTFETETKKHVWNVDASFDNYAIRLHMALGFSTEIHTDWRENKISINWSVTRSKKKQTTTQRNVHKHINHSLFGYRKCTHMGKAIKIHFKTSLEFRLSFNALLLIRTIWILNCQCTQHFRSVRFVFVRLRLLFAYLFTIEANKKTSVVCLMCL